MKPDISLAEEKYRNLYNATNNGIAIYSSTDGQRFNFTGLNSAGEKMSDVKFQDIVGREVREIFPGVVEMGLYDVLRRVWATGEAERLPVAFYDDRRISRYYENRVYKISDIELAAVYRDITDQKIVEDELARSEAKFRSLFESMQEGFALHEIICNDAGVPVDYRFIELNPAFERLTGLSRSAIINRTVLEVMPQTEAYWIESYGRVALAGEALDMENYSRELDRYYRVRAYSPERGKFAVVFEDVTEQKKSMLALMQRKDQLRVFFESSSAGIILVDPSGGITLANRRMAEMFGYTPEELLQLRYPDLVHTGQLSAGNERMRQLMAGEIDHVATERHYVRKDGSSFWGYLSGRRHVDAEGRLISLVGHITDISELKQKEELLKASEQKFRMLFEHSADPSLLIVGNSFVDCNQAAVDILEAGSKDALLNMHPSALSPEFQSDGRLSAEKADEMIAFAVRNGSHRFEWIHRRLCGELFPVEVSLTLIQESGQATIFTVWRDISERKQAEADRLKLEQQLLHAQKLESLGVLAGGIAHDFNNILTTIIGNADLALMRLNPESPAVGNLQNIDKAAFRAADLAKQMLAYSGKGKFVVESINLNRLLEEMLHMLEVSISKNAVLRLNLNSQLPAVEADATQMRQIVMNLVINASEAVGDRSGVIAITTGCMDCDRSYLKDVWLDENLTDGLYVYLEIVDTGCGMDQDTKARLFDPFFTTKFTGRGLGMAAVLGIVRGHKGAIKVYSEPGRGSSFKILIPASDRPAELFNHDSSMDAWKGSGTVLLVDDEETVRGIGSEMLKDLGFSAVTANDGREAVDIFRQRDDICFVILDLTMPHMDGEQCFRELKKLNPAVKVIMSSGYNEQEVTRKFVGKGLSGFLQKPYRLSALKDVIKAIR